VKEKMNVTFARNKKNTSIVAIGVGVEYAIIAV